MEKKQFTPTEQLKERVQTERLRFGEQIDQIDPEKLIFLDESGFNIAMTPSRGWGPKGARVTDSKPANWGKNFSVVGAIRIDRVDCHQVFEGAVNARRFIDFVKQRLCRHLQPGDVVVMDNLRVHHAPAVRKAIEARGARLLFLPPYSPDLNPIELCWSFIKNVIRQRRERTADLLKTAIKNAFLRVRSKTLKNWFAHCRQAQFKRDSL